MPLMRTSLCFRSNLQRIRKGVIPWSSGIREGIDSLAQGLLSRRGRGTRGWRSRRKSSYVGFPDYCYFCYLLSYNYGGLFTACVGFVNPSVDESLGATLVMTRQHASVQRWSHTQLNPPRPKPVNKEPICARGVRYMSRLRECCRGRSAFVY